MLNIRMHPGTRDLGLVDELEPEVVPEGIIDCNNISDRYFSQTEMVVSTNTW